MNATNAPTEPPDEHLLYAVRRLNRHVLGLVLGLTFGLLLFIATIWLVIKGGDPVGPHLSLLGQFFIGYSVSFVGGLVGLAYGIAFGYAIGWFIATVYNGIAGRRDRRRATVR